MIIKKLKDLTLVEINEEMEFASVDRHFKRIDHAQNFLEKQVQAGEITVNDDVASSFGLKTAKKGSEVAKPDKPKRVRVTLNYEDFTWYESTWQDTKVWVPKGKAFIIEEARPGKDKKETHFHVKLADGKTRVYAKHSVRFKPIDESYRDNYVHDSTVRTESGAISIYCGDTLSETLKGLVQDELQSVAKENGLDDKFRLWKEKNNPGLTRMHLGNVLRARLNRGEEVLIHGKKAKK